MNDTSEAKSKARTKDIELDENVTFSDLFLSKPVLEGLKQAGFFKPSPIQLKAIPLGKLGLDLIVQAKSGTGKTCVYTVLALEHVLLTSSSSSAASSAASALQVLVVSPTREVALQIDDCIRTVAAPATNIKCAAFIGGGGGGAAVSLKHDRDRLRSCQIAVGTPGRILHLINENLLNTTSIRVFVLDEADKLLAYEFQDAINAIFSKLPENKQTIFLSATYPPYIVSFAKRYMRSPTFVRLNIVDPSLRGIKQFYKITPYSNMNNVAFDYKVDYLIKLLSSIEFQQAIVFTNYQIKAESLCQTLTSNGWPAIFTSGSIEQTKRNQAMSQLKQFKCRILISTDLTSRGIDAQNVDLVVSMDVPADPETYLHRIGRAGRYGAYGTAVSFVTERDEAEQFENIINSYELVISQYNETLNDVILVRNQEKTLHRTDDVTIERVSLTQEEYDKSLFEYEKHKTEMRLIYEERKRERTAKNTKPVKQTKKKKNAITGDDKLEMRVTMDELERDLLRFKMQGVDRREDSLLLKTENGLEVFQVCLSANEVAKERAALEENMKRLLGLREDSVESEIEKEKIKNVNDLYKWVKVEKEKPKSTDVKTYDDFNRLYSHYYVHYYKHYFNEFYK